MHKLYSILIAMVAFVFFAPLAVAKPPFWDDQVNNTGRFKVLSEFSNAAVFDKETGLVWDQSPNTTTRTWFNALTHCYQREVGSRKGWRLPTVEELTSLVDINNISPALPTGHPFTLTSAQEDGGYWSATTDAFNTSRAWGVDLGGGSDVSTGDKSGSSFVWCVRGGRGIDGV